MLKDILAPIATINSQSSTIISPPGATAPPVVNGGGPPASSRTSSAGQVMVGTVGVGLAGAVVLLLGL